MYGALLPVHLLQSVSGDWTDVRNKIKDVWKTAGICRVFGRYGVPGTVAVPSSMWSFFHKKSILCFILPESDSGGRGAPAGPKSRRVSPEMGIQPVFTAKVESEKNLPGPHSGSHLNSSSSPYMPP
jgi:hypothetical protein